MSMRNSHSKTTCITVICNVAVVEKAAVEEAAAAEEEEEPAEANSRMHCNPLDVNKRHDILQQIVD